MKKLTLFFLFISSVLLSINPDPNWFYKAKLGIFIHWGLYSEIGYTEWAMDHFRISPDNYGKLASVFNPDSFDADSIVDLVKESGAKYLVFTAKHHDGFCLYDSKFTSYKITKTPFGKDVLKLIQKACQKRNIKFGIYYSVIDWHHPDYLPRRSWDNRPVTDADLNRYKSYFKNQLFELIRDYNPDIIWFDGGWEDTFSKTETDSLTAQIHTLKPQILINNRLSNNTQGNFITPEGKVPTTALFDQDHKPLLWENCLTMGDCWGYNPYQNFFYSERDLIRNLCDISSKGGNLLLNISPDPKGLIPVEQSDRLLKLGKWLSKNNEAIYESDPSIFKNYSFYGRSTSKNNNIYISLFQKNLDNRLFLPIIPNLKSVSFLNDPTLLRYKTENSRLIVSLPESLPDINASVIVIKTDQELSPISYKPIYSKTEQITLHAFDCLPFPAENTINLTQYYDKVLTDNWNYSNYNSKLEWEFILKDNSIYDIYIYATSRQEETGDMKMIFKTDNSQYDFILKNLPRWTALNKGLESPFKLENIELKTGLNHLSLSCSDLKNNQQVCFEKIILISK